MTFTEFCPDNAGELSERTPGIPEFCADSLLGKILPIHSGGVSLMSGRINPNQINWLAVFAAALSTFVIGGLWYSPVLFGKVWMRVNGFSEEQVAGFNKARAFGGSFILALVMSANLAMFLADPKTTVVWGMTAGALAGVGSGAERDWVSSLCSRIVRGPISWSMAATTSWPLSRWAPSSAPWQ